MVFEIVFLRCDAKMGLVWGGDCALAQRIEILASRLCCDTCDWVHMRTHIHTDIRSFTYLCLSKLFCFSNEMMRLISLWVGLVGDCSWIDSFVRCELCFGVADAM